MKKKISIVDYGLGNTVSAQQSFVKALKLKSFDAEVIITKNPKDIYTSTHIVLPGQGAFISCMQGLRDVDGMIDTLEEYVLQKKITIYGNLCWNAIISRQGVLKKKNTKV